MNKIGASLLIILLIFVLFFSPILFSARKISGNYGDLYLHYYPLKHLAASEIISGNLPLWNPYIFAGEPLLANPQSAVFYPLSIPFYFFPLHLSFNYSILLHFFLGGLFFFLLISGLRFSHSSAFFCSLVFSMSAFLVYQVPAGHYIALTGYIWMPLIILFLNKTSEELSAMPAFLLSTALTFQFFSGQLFPIYISLIFILFHFTSKRFSYSKALLFAGIIFLLLSAVQFLPTLELSSVSQRSNWPALASAYSIHFRNLITLILPNFFGNSADSTLAGEITKSFFIEKDCLFFGIIPLILALTGFFYCLYRQKYFYPLLLILGIILALGFNTPAYRILYSFLPGLNFLRAPSRFFFLSLISLIIMSAFGWQYLISKFGSRIKFALIALAFLNLFFWGKKFIFAQDIEPYIQKSALASYANPLYRLVTEPEKFSPNRSMLNRTFNLNGYEAIFLEGFTNYLGLQEKESLSSTGLARWKLNSPLSKGFSVRYVVSAGSPDGLKKLGALSRDAGIYEFNNFLPKVFIADKCVYIPSGEPYAQMDYLRKTPRTPQEELLLGDETGNIASLAGGKGRLVSYKCDPARIEAELSIDSPSAVVFSEVSYPGWMAASGDQKLRVIRGNKIFRTLILKKGDYTGKKRIILYFSPLSLFFGVTLTLLCLFTAGVLFLFGNFFKKYFKNI